MGGNKMRNVVFKGNEFTSVGDQGQDLFAYICNDCEPGFWIDMGARDFKPPYDYGANNTYGLYKAGWKGISFDLANHAASYPSDVKFFNVDCTNQEKIDKIFQENEDDIPEIINYLSIDMDKNSYAGLKTIDLNKYKFVCMTVEHCAKLYGEERNKIKERELLLDYGYEIVVPWNNFEDWYIHPDLVDKTRLEPLKKLHSFKQPFNSLDYNNIIDILITCS